MMKNLLLIIAFFSFTVYGSAQTDVLINGNFESWDDANNPTGWTKVESVDQESGAENVHGGDYSAKHTGGTSDLGQTIYGIVGGDNYAMTIWYKILEADGTDARPWCYWKTDGTNLDDDADILRDPGFYLDNNGGVWTMYTLNLTAPLAANEFYFEVRTYSGAVTYWDDFSFIHDTGVYPEPTNYPTDFTAEAVEINVITSWTDATGDQLPNAYLILGNNDNSDFTAPIDGVPVANDLDWEDGKVAVNVLHGVETYSFLVEASKTYNFTIYPYTNTGENINYKTDGTPPTASAVSNNLTIANIEGFDNNLGSWTGYNVNGDQLWEWAGYGLPPGCAAMSGNDDGNNYANEDWLISPSLDLSNYEEMYFRFDHARNYGTNDGLSVLVSTDYDGSSDPSTNGTWSVLTSMFTFPEEGSWNFIEAGEIDVSMYNGANTYFAFKYISTTDDCATWEVDNALIYGTVTTGIEESITEKIQLYPNPATGKVNLSCQSDGLAQIINLKGQIVLQSDIRSGQNTIDIQKLNSGLYMINFTSTEGISIVQKLFIQ